MEADMAEQAYTVCGGRMYLVPVILYMVEYPSDSDDRQGGKSGDRYGCRESPERDGTHYSGSGDGDHYYAGISRLYGGFCYVF